MYISTNSICISCFISINLRGDTMNYKYCMIRKCNECKKQVKCDNKEKEKDKKKVGEVNGK